jgi:SAM-dependent methyltransferase
MTTTSGNVADHAASQIGPGAAVLEIGCGTGQFTRHLAGRALNLTAIDIGAAMVQAARRHVADAIVRFQVCSFEDFPDAGPFDLVVSATALHWVDPSVGLAKAARLLRPGGWLALLTTGERYPEPLQGSLRELWVRYSRETGTWADTPAWLTALRENGTFGETVEVSHASALRLPAETVIGVERTRATFLSYAEQDQADFNADLKALLEPGSHINPVQERLSADWALRSGDSWRHSKCPSPCSPLPSPLSSSVPRPSASHRGHAYRCRTTPRRRSAW